jgi:hypothetical protein
LKNCNNEKTDNNDVLLSPLKQDNDKIHMNNTVVKPIWIITIQRKLKWTPLWFFDMTGLKICFRYKYSIWQRISNNSPIQFILKNNWSYEKMTQTLKRCNVFYPNLVKFSTKYDFSIYFWAYFLLFIAYLFVFSVTADICKKFRLFFL